VSKDAIPGGGELNLDMLETELRPASFPDLEAQGQHQKIVEFTVIRLPSISWKIGVVNYLV
jgi:hypothetical protein